MANLVHSLSQNPRVVYLLYRNPLFENVLARYPAFNRIAGTPQYSIFGVAGQLESPLLMMGSS